MYWQSENKCDHLTFKRINEISSITRYISPDALHIMSSTSTFHLLCDGEQPDLLPWQNIKKRAADTDSPSKRFAADAGSEPPQLSPPSRHVEPTWYSCHTPPILLKGDTMGFTRCCPAPTPTYGSSLMHSKLSSLDRCEVIVNTSPDVMILCWFCRNHLFQLGY